MEVFGNFYFDILENGTLTGEYFDSVRKQLDPETATPAQPNQGLLGKYMSTWYENGESNEAILSIEPGSSNSIYLLEWSRDGRTIYQGNGYISDKKLIGHYQKI